MTALQTTMKVNARLAESGTVINAASVIFGVLIAIYVINSIIASLAAKKQHRLRQLIAMDTWITFLLVLFFPILVSWITAWVHDPEQTGPYPLLYFGSLAGLTVLLTIEFSILNDLITEKKPVDRLQLLICTLGLDFCSFLVLAFYTFNNAPHPVIGMQGRILVLYLCSLGSSSLVILLTRKADEPPRKAEEPR